MRRTASRSVFVPDPSEVGSSLPQTSSGRYARLALVPNFFGADLRSGGCISSNERDTVWTKYLGKKSLVRHGRTPSNTPSCRALQGIRRLVSLSSRMFPGLKLLAKVRQAHRRGRRNVTKPQKGIGGGQGNRGTVTQQDVG
jgi:hypothetical protein